MIDTIVVQFFIHIASDVLATWDMHRYIRGSGFVVSYKLSIRSTNGAEITYQYFPYVQGGLLKIEFSLPHIVLGSNAYMVYDIEQAVNQANAMLPEIPGVPKLDLWEGELYRLDICYNHQVGALVPYYVRALQFLEYARRRTSPYTSEGVMFVNKQVCTKFYNKLKKCLKDKDYIGSQVADGILRQETSLRKLAVKKLTGKKHPALRDIRLDMLMGALENDLLQLELLGRSIATRKTALEQLCAAYGPRAGVYYFGLLVSKVEQSSKEIIRSATGLHPKSLDRQLEKIVQVDIPLTLTETEEPLPPLVIDREMTIRIAQDVLVSQSMG